MTGSTGRSLSSDASPCPSPRTPSSPRSAASCPTSPASTSSATPSGACSTSARPSRSASGSNSHFSKPAATPGAARDGRRDRPHRVRRHRRPRPRRCSPSRTSSSSYKPRFNIRLRDDKSYPYIAISLDEDYPARLLHARAPPPRPRLLRPLLERQAGARHARPARQGLPVPHLRRPRAGPALRLALPRLLHQALRGALRRLRLARRSTAATSTASSTSSPGRYRQIERELEARMRQAAEEQEFEQAALYRNRLRAVRSLLERQRVANEAVGTLDAVAVAVDGTDANAQVFQVRDGVLADRQSFYLDNEAGATQAEVAEEFMLQYYASAMSIPREIVVPARRSASATRWREALSRAPRRRRSRSAPAERGDKRRILELAERNAAARARPGQAARRAPAPAPHRGARRAAAGARRWTRSRCGSSASTSRTSAAPTRSRRWSCSRAARRRSPTTGASPSAPSRARDDFASMEEVLSRRLAQFEAPARALAARPRARRELRRAAEPRRDRRRQGPALGRPASARRASATAASAIVSLAKRIEEVFMPGRADAARARPRHARAAAAPARARRGAPLRDRPPPHPPRPGDDRRRCSTSCPASAPARKRALLQHFGSPDAVAGATREQLEAVPGVPGKVAREVYAQLHKTGR